MQTPPRLFDTALATERRRRVTDAGLFMHRRIADLTAERLSEVNRPFSAPAILGPSPEIWASALARRCGVADPRLAAAEETLPLSPAAHDLIVHGLALHGANDPVGQLIQMRRALRPDGLCLVALFGGESLWELRQSFAAAEAEVLGGATPRVHPMGDIKALGGLLQRARFALPVADSISFPVSYPNCQALFADLRAMGETNVLHRRARKPISRQLLQRVISRYEARFGDGAGRIAATFEVIFLTGWAPHQSQPKPLRPGSATMRLAEALGDTTPGATPDAGESGNGERG